MPSRLCRHSFTALLLTLSLTGCTAWRREPAGLAQPFGPRTPVQVFTPGSSLVAHGVRVGPDSVRVVPRWQPPSCDSCAVTFPLAAIDSIRVRRFSPGRTVALGVVIGAILYGMAQVPPPD